MESIEVHARRYLREIEDVVAALPYADIPPVAAILLDAWRTGRHVFVCGNGGSAATASHFVNDLNKGANVPGKRRFRALGLVDNTPLLMAWSNDSAYEHAMAEQLINFIEPGDVMIAISGSGNSVNVLNAVHVARENGAVTIGLTGFNGGRLKPLVDHSLHVPSSVMEQVEDAHLILCHTLTVTLRAMIAATAAHDGAEHLSLNGYHTTTTGVAVPYRRRPDDPVP